MSKRPSQPPVPAGRERRSRTETEGTAEEVRRSQHFLAATLGALPWRLAVLDEKGTVIAVNTAWERFSGADPLASPALGLGGNFLAACDAAARDAGAAGEVPAAKVGAGFRELVAGERARFALEYPSRDREHWYLLRLALFEGGGPARVVLAVEDVSKRKRAEEAFYQSMTRTRVILDSAVDGIITIDPHGRIETMNPAAERMFGYAAADLLGQNVKVLMPSPYRNEHDDYLSRYLATGEKKIIGIGREVVGRRRDGSTFPMDLAVSEVRLGEQLSFMGTVRDITARKEIEEELRRQRDFAESLVETAQAIVLVLDCDGRIVRFNRYLEQIIGFTLEELQGRDWFDTLLPERHRAIVREVFVRVLRNLPTRGHVNPILTRTGEEREIEWYNTTLTGPDGNVVGVLATGQDITERRQLEEQFRQAQKMEAIGRLAGGVAHDFNTLLGSIIGYSEMLLAQLAEDDPRRKAVAQIRRGAERGAGLTRQLLAFSRRQVLQPQVLDLNAVVREMDDMLRRLVSEDIHLVYDLDTGLGVVEVDAGQIQQVIMNLIVNAADAIALDPVRELTNADRITVATRNVEIDESHPERDRVLVAGRYVVLQVSDTGCGMDERTRAQIFDPFFTTKEQGKGTGLGLSTVYGIVRQSGGGVAVDSRPGAGATFRVYLLRAGGAVELAPPVAAADAAAGGTETILLVEDDEMFLELLREVLTASGYRVLAAGDPEAALRLSEECGEAIALLVTDMVMPGMTGTELARQLLARHPGLCVLLMSGYSDEALELRGRHDRQGTFLQKPFSTTELTRTVREVLDGRGDRASAAP